MWPEVPFPVQVPHEVKSDLSKVSNDPFSKKLVVLDDQRALYRAEKLKVLVRNELQAVQGTTQAPNDCLAALEQIHEILSNDSCALEAFVDSGELQKTVRARFDHLALQLQDDIVIMRLHDDQFYPELMHVCFPSGWNPADKFAQSLASIHEPVADGERLVKATNNLSSAMVNKGPFVRYVWTLAAAPQLSQHPLVKVIAHENQAVESIYFRCERQVTIPLPQLNRSCFLIRVFVVPITHVVNSQERRKLLGDALHSMSAATIAYKGIAKLIPSVTSWIKNTND